MSAQILELSTNGLEGQRSEDASPIQEPIRFNPIHWTDGEKSPLDLFIKGLSTRKQPMDSLHNDFEKDHRARIMLPIDREYNDLSRRKKQFLKYCYKAPGFTCEVW